MNLVLSIGGPAAIVPLVDGFGLFSPATGATLDAQAQLLLSGFVLPNPAVGISVTVQAVYLDPSSALGFNLTWARYPDRL